MTETDSKKRVFSGIQPSGTLHIGNYLGAIKNWVAMQHQTKNVFCIVDLHAITVPQDPKALRAKIRELALLYLACGLDLKHCAIFVQSHISAHSELTWILNCFTPMGWLERMTQYKDKSAKQEVIGAGLFDYPVLMAADILLYDTHLVPVGDDQKQHVELTRDVAQRFNHLYDAEVFVVPEVMIPKAGARIKGLDDPTAKMSKSADSAGHALGLLDPPKVLRKAIMRATTDSLRSIRFNHEQPGVLNLLTIYQAITGGDEASIEAEFEGKGYGDLKKRVAEAVIETLKPIQERYHQMAADPGYIEQVLKDGADRVRPIAENRLKVVRETVGLG